MFISLTYCTFPGTKVIALKLNLALIISHKKSCLPPFRQLTPTEESNTSIANLNYGKGVSQYQNPKDQMHFMFFKNSVSRAD